MRWIKRIFLRLTTREVLLDDEALPRALTYVGKDGCRCGASTRGTDISHFSGCPAVAALEPDPADVPWGRIAQEEGDDGG